MVKPAASKKRKRQGQRGTTTLRRTPKRWDFTVVESVHHQDDNDHQDDEDHDANVVADDNDAIAVASGSGNMTNHRSSAADALIDETNRDGVEMDDGNDDDDPSSDYEMTGSHMDDDNSRSLSESPSEAPCEYRSHKWRDIVFWKNNEGRRDNVGPHIPVIQSCRLVKEYEVRNAQRGDCRVCGRKTKTCCNDCAVYLCVDVSADHRPPYNISPLHLNCWSYFHYEKDTEAFQKTLKDRRRINSC